MNAYKDTLKNIINLLHEDGYEIYYGQSLLGCEDVIHGISKDGELIEIIYNAYPDEDILQAIKGLE